jgi:hypothetical protein
MKIQYTFFQLSPKGTLSLREIQHKFDDLHIPREQYDDIVQIGTFNNDVQWDHFLAIAVSKLAKVNFEFFRMKSKLIIYFFCIRI